MAYNGGAGIAVIGSLASANQLRPAIDFANAGLPVDLGGDGATANDSSDADSGPNGLLNYPVVTSYSSKSMSGTACPNCTVFLYFALGDPRRAHGGGQIQALVAYTDFKGTWKVTLTSGLYATNVTLQACQAVDCLVTTEANTSEFSPPVRQFFLPMVNR